MAWLRAEHVSKHYGGVSALTAARFELEPGEVHALMGENGAGKSTLGRILAGSERADRGEFWVDGQQVTIGSPRDAQRLGIGIIHQELDLFPHLSVGENLVIGNLRFGERVRVSPRRIDDFARPLLAQVGLGCSPRELVAALSIAEQQMVAIARTLGMGVRVLIMDEPTSALPEDAAERLFARIAALKADGVGIVYVSHKMQEIFRLSDRLTVLRNGETVDTRVTATTTADEIIRLMVGHAIPAVAKPPRASGAVVLDCASVTTRKLRQVSFAVRTGEVLGIAGLVGAGRSAVGAMLAGIDPVQSGSLRINGQAYTPEGVQAAMRSGVGVVPEDRRLQGLMMQMSVRENATLSSVSTWSVAGFPRVGAERKAVATVSGRLRLTPASQDVAVRTLSGGNQQKTLLTRVLLLDPRILFLDDPTRGIDVAAKEDVYQLIDALAAEGKAVILVSSELPELLRCADRILVLRDGWCVGEMVGARATQAEILALATGSVA
jgi:ABC-type sugar transport system ATPase subunit